jgi:arylsulfatase A-like enzyme
MAVHHDRWKVVKHAPDTSWDLYDIAIDPTETHNLEGIYPDHIVEMDDLFRKWWKRVNE